MNASINQAGIPAENLAIGTIIEVDGSRIVAELDKRLPDLSRVYSGDIYPIGQFGSVIRMHFGQRIIYGFVTRLYMKAEYELEHGASMPISIDQRVIEANLFGEAEWKSQSDGCLELQFHRGVITYPLPQQTVYLTPKSELHHIYGYRSNETPTIALGEHVGSGGAPCYADLNELLGKHTAILGSTGTGKSATVAAIVHSILEKTSNSQAPWKPQIIILDPHNEYNSAFADCKQLSTEDGTLELPYWLLNLDETINLLIGKTEHAATSQSNIVKNALLEVRSQTAKSLGLDINRLTVDAPVPYPLGDPSGLDFFGNKSGHGLYQEGLVGAINRQRPETSKSIANHIEYEKVIRKIESLIKDRRLAFLMNPWKGECDSIPDLLAKLSSEDGRPIVVDLSGVPNEVVGIASAAIVRTIFSIKVWQTPVERQKSPVLLICEEAHRYIPNSGEAQYEAAQSAIRRVATEGRKFGIGLFIVSQRPTEVEATVLSQCSSWLVLRTSNEADRSYVRGILPDSMEGLTNVLSGLRRQEAVFVGLAATLPSRILVRSLEDEQLPSSSDIDFNKGWHTEPISRVDLECIAARWRYQTRE